MTDLIEQSSDQHPRKILLATVGLVPQVVTETLFALVRQGHPPFIPTEIHVITTLEGGELTRLMLIDPARAVLARFAEEFEVPEVAAGLTPSRIHIIAGEDGLPLTDITSEADNRATADLIARLVRELTSDPHSALHVSIAGGRKTMGFLIGTALSLYGRPQDKLSHVLISPPSFEQHPEFFYPPRIPEVLQDPRERNRPIDTRDARVTLAEIPYVRLRNGLPARLLAGDWSYSETVARAQRLVRAPALVIDRDHGLLSCGGTIIRLTPVNFAFYAWLAARRLELGDAAGVHSMETSADELFRAHINVPGLPPHILDKLRVDLSKGAIPDSMIQSRKNRVNSALTAALGQDDTPYHIGVVSLIPGTQYERQGLLLDRTAISLGTLASMVLEYD